MLTHWEKSFNLGIVWEDFTKELRLPFGLGYEVGWIAENSLDRNNLDLKKRGYVSKVTVRRFLFVRAPLEVREGWKEILNVKTIGLMKNHRNVDSGY